MKVLKPKQNVDLSAVFVRAIRKADFDMTVAALRQLVAPMETPDKNKIRFIPRKRYGHDTVECHYGSIHLWTRVTDTASGLVFHYESPIFQKS